MEISRKVLFINIIISQVVLILLAIGIHFLIPNHSFVSLLNIKLGIKDLSIMIIGVMLLLLVQYLFLKYISKERLFDDINRLLLTNFSLTELVIIFGGGAFSEEILFRGVIQPYLGIWLTSLFFTVIHFRYIKKFFIVIEVFLMGLVLGFSYHLTSSLWVPILCHFTVNISTAFMIKKGYLEY